MPEPTPSVRRLLVLGTSSSEGVGIARRDEAYPQLLGRMLSATCGEVEVIHRRYYAHMPGAGDFFAAQLAAFPADWVVLQTTAFGLTLRTVPIRIEQLFGARAGRLAKNMVGGWEDPSQAPPGGHKFRDAARWLAHHTIGTATATRYEPLIEGYKAAIEQMARLETTWTATIGTGQPHSVLVKLNPSAPDTVRRFNAELFEAVRAHRIPWIDHDAVPHDSSHDAGFVDFIHRNAAWHERIAAELFAAISVPAGVSR